jgi:hypothetical protein
MTGKQEGAEFSSLLLTAPLTWCAGVQAARIEQMLGQLLTLARLKGIENYETAVVALAGTSGSF